MLADCTKHCKYKRKFISVCECACSHVCIKSQPFITVNQFCSGNNNNTSNYGSDNESAAIFDVTLSLLLWLLHCIKSSLCVAIVVFITFVSNKSRIMKTLVLCEKCNEYLWEMMGRSVAFPVIFSVMVIHSFLLMLFTCLYFKKLHMLIYTYKTRLHL